MLLFAVLNSVSLITFVHTYMCGIFRLFALWVYIFAIRCALINVI